MRHSTPDGNSLCPDSPYYFFCPDGSYEIYDYRSPGELRIDALGEALVLGHFTTGKVSHDVVGGGSLFHRSVDLSSTIVYAPLGCRKRLSTEYSLRARKTHTSKPAPPLSPTSITRAPASSRNARTCPVTSCFRQAAALRTSPISTTPQPDRLWLPQYGATYSPLHDLTLYGNYGVAPVARSAGSMVGR